MPELLDFAELGEGIGDATAVLRSNAASAGLDAAVPSRAGITVRDLVVEQGVEHREATAELRAEPGSQASLAADATAASDLLEWLDDGMVEVLNALAGGQQDRQAWFFTGAAPSDRQQAARRLCHSATRRGIEAMAARIGRLPRAEELWFSPVLARDGLDWLGVAEAPDEPRAAYLSALVRRPEG